MTRDAGDRGIPELTKLQRAFQFYVLRGRPSGIQEAIAPPPGGDTPARLAVYRDGYTLRLIGALRSDYPVLQAMVGDARFDELARSYVGTRRSRHPNLRWYGADFARFLCGHVDRQDALAEMAAWEWALGSAFDAADATVVDATTLTGVPSDRWPSIAMAFHPSVRRVDLRTDAPGAWKQHHEGERPEPLVRATSMPWLVWRRELQVMYRSMEEDEAWALNSAMAGADFARLCSGLLRWKSEETAVVAWVGFLHTWLRDGLVTSISAR